MTRSRIARALIAFVIVVLLLDAQRAVAAQPPHPTRVAEALAAPWDSHLERVWTSDLYVDGATLNPTCTAWTRNGVRSRTVNCRVRSTTVGSFLIRGTMKPGRCRDARGRIVRDRVFEDASGRVSLRTMRGAWWCYPFRPRA